MNNSKDRIKALLAIGWGLRELAREVKRELVVRESPLRFSHASLYDVKTGRSNDLGGEPAVIIRDMTHPEVVGPKKA